MFIFMFTLRGSSSGEEFFGAGPSGSGPRLWVNFVARDHARVSVPVVSDGAGWEVPGGRRGEWVKGRGSTRHDGVALRPAQVVTAWAGLAPDRGRIHVDRPTPRQGDPGGSMRGDGRRGGPGWSRSTRSSAGW